MLEPLAEPSWELFATSSARQQISTFAWPWARARFPDRESQGEQASKRSGARGEARDSCPLSAKGPWTKRQSDRKRTNGGCTMHWISRCPNGEVVGGTTLQPWTKTEESLLVVEKKCEKRPTLSRIKPRRLFHSGLDQGGLRIECTDHTFFPTMRIVTSDQ